MLLANKLANFTVQDNLFIASDRSTVMSDVVRRVKQNNSRPSSEASRDSKESMHLVVFNEIDFNQHLVVDIAVMENATTAIRKRRSNLSSTDEQPAQHGEIGIASKSDSAMTDSPSCSKSKNEHINNAKSSFVENKS